jgi:CheY-like chemotaxis protein
MGVTLFIKEPRHAMHQNVETMSAASIAPDDQPPQKVWAMKTVLIVDDEYMIAEILSFALQDEGVTTIIAGCGLKALDILDSEQPDLLITDFMMPGMTGIELAEAIRARDAYGLMPMILMSGAQASLGLARSDLFVEVFEKPFDIDLVIARVKSILGPG